jgi:hypothetical protein
VKITAKRVRRGGEGEGEGEAGGEGEETCSEQRGSTGLSHSRSRSHRLASQSVQAGDRATAKMVLARAAGREPPAGLCS